MTFVLNTTAEMHTNLCGKFGFSQISMLNPNNTEPNFIPFHTKIHTYLAPKGTVFEILIPYFFDFSTEFQKCGHQYLRNWS